MNLVIRKFKGLRRRVSKQLRLLRSWEELENRPPMVLKTELTNICNANCIFCGYQYLNRPKGFMLDETFSKVIKDYRCMGGTTLSFVPVVGDPLVDRRFLEKVREAKQNGFSRIYAYTNGIWLYRFNPLELLSSGLDSLVFSVPPMEKQKFEILYRSSEYEGLLRGLRALLEENAKAGWPVEISFRVRSDMPAKQVLRLPDYQEHVKPFLREESSQVGISLDYDDWGGMIKQEVLVGEMRLTKLKVIRRMPCQNLFNLTVLWNGDVHACGCRFSTLDNDRSLIIGSIHDSSLKEIWHGRALRGLRRAFPGSVLPLTCRNCRAYSPV